MMPLFLVVWLHPAQADDEADQQAAETAFDAVMQQNMVSGGGVGALGYVDGAPRAAPATVAPAPPEVPTPSADAEAVVPLDRYEAARSRIAAAAAAEARSFDSLVVLGGSTWTGRSTSAGLELHLTLQATLRGPGFWKSVPVVGDEVAVVRARVGKETVALTSQGGYQVWVTDRVGEVSVEVDVVVPAAGPRGSIEYDFLVARTPITRFDCHFGETGLEPRLRGAVRSEVSETVGATELSAFLEPTSRIHLVGYRDMGDDEGRAARLYVEAVSLLSVEEDAADLFSVFHYSILQAGSRQFDILVPKGFNVVSADGAGGFRYTTETTADGTVLHGETVFPIRDQYEVSLRLTQPHDRGALAVSPPRTLGAERESGWLGLEVLDTVQVSETARTEAVAVDVTQLPEELLQSAVSPVLQGWRYHTAGASVVLDATPLPEREPSTGSIDQVEATTRISAEGRAQTRLRVTLRNRLRHSLALRLAEGVELTAAHIDGKPVVPSAGADGAVMLPLRRSAGGSRPVPFTLELEVEGEVGGFGVLGVRDLELPAFGLPISTLRWTVEGPAHSRYTRLYGEVEPQDGTTLDATTDGDRRTLRHSRYWIAANKPVGVTFGWVRGWLVAPLEAVGVLLALGLLWRKRSRWGGDRLVVGLRGAWARVRSTSEVAPAPGGWRAMGLARRGVLVVGTLAASGMLVLLGLRVLWVLSNPWG